MQLSEIKVLAQNYLLSNEFLFDEIHQTIKQQFLFLCDICLKGLPHVRKWVAIQNKPFLSLPEESLGFTFFFYLSPLKAMSH